AHGRDKFRDEQAHNDVLKDVASHIARRMRAETAAKYREEFRAVEGGHIEEGEEFSTFGGIKGSTADLGMLDRAKQMELDGTDPREIWRETGWWHRKDGWRYEIDDSDVDFVPGVLNGWDGIYEAIKNKDPDAFFSYDGRLGDLVRNEEEYPASPVVK